jgi:hypothetical protein
MATGAKKTLNYKLVLLGESWRWFDPLGDLAAARLLSRICSADLARFAGDAAVGKSSSVERFGRDCSPRVLLLIVCQLSQ